MNVERHALYPGSFDPVTLGHMDIVTRAASLFDKVTVAVAHSGKAGLLGIDERVALFRDSVSGLPNVEVQPFSGLLVDELGGASVRPQQPLGYYRHLNFPKRKYGYHADRRQWRRGVYVHWQRQFLHPMLKAFDAPSREECTAQRPRSNTPTAALVLLNDPAFVEAARAFAARILSEQNTTTGERLTYAYRVALSRAPSAEEIALLKELLTANEQRYSADPKAASALIATGDAPVPTDLKPVELASWTMVARVILNLNETISRN